MYKTDPKFLEGVFTLASGQDVHGHLENLDSKPELRVYAREYIRKAFQTTSDIHGTLHDRTKVSLLECVTTALTSYGKADGGGSHYSAIAYPHLVLTGDDHITSTERRVRDVHFEISDATTLFYDTDAFGMVLDAGARIGEIAPEDQVTSSSDSRQQAEIFYYTGKGEIFSAQTVIGRVSATHCPSTQLPGAQGFRLDNSVMLSIEFEKPVTVIESVKHAVDIRRLTEILIGRSQSFMRFELRLISDSEHPTFLALHCNDQLAHPGSSRAPDPQPTDTLIQAAAYPDEIQRVVVDWLARQVSWNDARKRFAKSFDKQSFYDIDRLVGAANMFDILPSGALARLSPLDPALAEARELTRDAFRKLPQSPERDSVLGALGRLGKHNLKQKVRSRATPIAEVADSLFPELGLVLDEAVNCRNHYVHGSDSSVSYDENFSCVMFFVDTFEFIFAASDLMDAGWDIDDWLKRSATLSHPFTRYRFSYQDNLNTLKDLLGRSADV